MVTFKVVHNLLSLFFLSDELALTVHLQSACSHSYDGFQSDEIINGIESNCRCF